MTLYHPDKTLTACVTGYRIDFLGPDGTTLESATVPAVGPTDMTTTAVLPPKVQQLLKAAAAATAATAAAAAPGVPSGLSNSSTSGAATRGQLRMRVTALDGTLRGAPHQLAPYVLLPTAGGGLEACRDGAAGAPRGLHVSAYGSAARGSNKWDTVSRGRSLPVVAHAAAARARACRRQLGSW